MLNRVFHTSDDVVLIFDIQLVEVAAPAPYAHNEVRIILGVLLCIQQPLAIDGIELQLVTAEEDKAFDKHGDLFDTDVVSQYRVVDLKGERPAVDDLGHIVFGKGLQDRQKTAGFHVK